jgi:hypothetical protein
MRRLGEVGVAPLAVGYGFDPFGWTSFLDRAGNAAGYVVRGGIGFGFGTTAAVKFQLNAWRRAQEPRPTGRLPSVGPAT